MDAGDFSPAQESGFGSAGRRYGDFVRFLLKSAAVGAAAGLVGVAFRLALSGAESWREQVLAWGRGLPGPGWLLLPAIGALIGGLAGWLTEFAPESAGSGIPHVEAVLTHGRDLTWWRLIPLKFLGGVMAIGAAGLSLGREGPTVQMGAAAGQAVSKAMRQPRAVELQLVACGAGAGLAAAFNAPLAGVVFVLEELRRNLSPYVLGGAVAACVVADIVAWLTVGPRAAFQVVQFHTLPLAALPLFVLLGALAGLLGAAFNRGLEESLELASRLRGVPRWVRAASAASLAGLLGYFLPQVLGGGHPLAMDLIAGKVQAGFGLLLILLAAKYLLTMVSYGAGVPGGIFLPLLTLGALLGGIVGLSGRVFFPGLTGLPPSLVIVGMAACFVAIVRAPLTGVILIIELTGRYQQMLPLLLACSVSYLVAELVGSPPIYEALLQREIARGGATQADLDEDTSLLELTVETGAPACGCQVMDLPVPLDCLLVSVRRGPREMIPRGHTKLMEGDVLRVMVPAGRAGAIHDDFAALACCRLAKSPSQKSCAE
ncbi:MAG: H(+)/Cl(-) exchange transporter ClcA [Chitinophagales bacterium]